MQTLRHRVELPAGTLSLAVTRSDRPLEALCGFASRANAKRGFLFVSKVLGKHIPVRPSEMEAVHRKLAGQVRGALEDVDASSLLCIALAETATGLGQSVYEHLIHPVGPLPQDATHASPLPNALFIHSTRYRLSHHAILHFEESHSHASHHLIHIPQGALEAEVFHTAKTLVLIDDEMSTGSTFVNLARAYAEVNPALERVVLVTLTDWAGERRRRELAREMPVQTHFVSLLEGEYTWEANPDHVLEPTRAAHGNGEAKDALLGHNFGRLGVTKNPRADFEGLWEEVGPIPVGAQHAAPLRGETLVLGTGEFTYLPFEFAHWLEGQGLQVHFQSTTRSPILAGGAIAHKLAFPDNYSDGIVNYVYNLEPERYGLILVCAETPLEPDHPLLVQTGGIPVIFR